MEPGPCPHRATPSLPGEPPCSVCRDEAAPTAGLTGGGTEAGTAAAGSYSERYRGTEWGSPVEPSPSPSVAGGAAHRPAMLIWGTGLALLALIGVVGFSMITSRPPGPVVPAGAGPQARATAAPVAPRVTQGGVVQAFVERVTARGFAYSVDFSAGFTASEYGDYEVLRLSGAMDVRGDDFAGTWRVRSQNDNAQVGMIMIDDVGFMRLPEEDWECLGELPVRPEVSPFARLESADDVSYEGIKQEHGYRFHRLRIAGASTIAPWMADDPVLREAEVRALLYDAFVTDDGTPSRAEFTARIRVPDGLTKTEIKISGEYRFRGVDGEKRISRPLAGCGGAAPA